MCALIQGIECLLGSDGVAILTVGRMIKDERTKQEELRTIFDVKDAAERLG